MTEDVKDQPTKADPVPGDWKAAISPDRVETGLNPSGFWAVHQGEVESDPL